MFLLSDQYLRLTEPSVSSYSYFSAPERNQKVRQFCMCNIKLETSKVLFWKLFEEQLYSISNFFGLLE